MVSCCLSCIKDLQFVLFLNLSELTWDSFRIAVMYLYRGNASYDNMHPLFWGCRFTPEAASMMWSALMRWCVCRWRGSWARWSWVVCRWCRVGLWFLWVWTSRAGSCIPSSFWSPLDSYTALSWPVRLGSNTAESLSMRKCYWSTICSIRAPSSGHNNSV